MKGRIFIISCVAALMPLLFSSFSGAATLQSRALKSLQDSVVKALPAGKMTRLAVLDFKGDEFGIGNGITSAISEKTSWKVMERSDFNKILAEQGLQLKDIMDGRTRIRHGRLRGVQGLLMGNVYSVEKDFLSYRVHVYVKLVDVERGEILMSRDFEASATAPWRGYLFMAGAGFLGVVILCVFITLIARRRTRVSRARIGEERQGNREGMAREVDRIIGHVSEAKSRLVETGKITDAVELKEIERSLMDVRRSVSGPFQKDGSLNDGARSAGDIYSEREMFWKLEDLEKLSGRIAHMASSGLTENVDREIGLLRSAVLKVDSELRSRRGNPSLN